MDFTGEIVHGQRFERPIVDGLIFRLDPEPGAAGTGWMVRVIRLPEEDEDYAGVMTPPYRGVNHRFIEGWHFRNRENTGVNQSDVNAPQYDREFGFVLTRDD